MNPQIGLPQKGKKGSKKKCLKMKIDFERNVAFELSISFFVLLAPFCGYLFLSVKSA